jgi:hypothetical protein
MGQEQQQSFSNVTPIPQSFDNVTPIEGQAQPFGNAGNAQKPMVTPLPGESFEDTIKRAIAMGKTVTPEQIKSSTQGAIKQIPTVLGAAAAAGPALLTAGAIAPAAASEAAGGGILGAAAGGATAGAGTSILTQPTQGQNPFSIEGLKGVGESALAGGLTGGLLGGAGKLAGKVLAPFTDLEGNLRIPSFSNAGKGFQEVSSVVAKHPVEMTDALSKSAFQVSQFARNGSQMPSPVSKFLERITDPDLPPLTYDDARQFYTNINKLTAADKMTTNPQMKMYISQLAHDLGDSIEATAARGGQQQTFVNSMKEWHDASRVDDAKEAIREHAVEALIKGAAGGAGAYGAAKIAKNVWDKN